MIDFHRLHMPGYVWCFAVVYAFGLFSFGASHLGRESLYRILHQPKVYHFIHLLGHEKLCSGIRDWKYFVRISSLVRWDSSSARIKHSHTSPHPASLRLTEPWVILSLWKDSIDTEWEFQQMKSHSVEMLLCMPLLLLLLLLGMKLKIGSSHLAAA